jgi:hypothetical protein
MKNLDDRLSFLMEKIRLLEAELLAEMEQKQREFYYSVTEKRVRFEREAHLAHKKLLERVPRYLYNASLLNMLSTPIIWFCLLPAVLMDLVVTFYQTVCFPLYGIPKVRRGDHIVIDRHYLAYLNVIEKLNCCYCGYFNGVVSYAGEVAARTEQYWCPIKHARKMKSAHSRYRKFLDYGDAKAYRGQLEKLRRDFDDLRN